MALPTLRLLVFGCNATLNPRFGGLDPRKSLDLYEVHVAEQERKCGAPQQPN